MEYFFSYKSKQNRLNLFFDTRCIDFISLMKIETERFNFEYKDDSENNKNNSDDNYIIKRRSRYYKEPIVTIQLLLKIHFKNTNYHQELVFDKDDEEAYIIYNSLIEAINKNPQSCH